MSDPTTPAVRKIQDRLKELFEAARPDMFWFIDRSDADPIPEAQRPAGMIRLLDVSFSMHTEMNQTIHRATCHVEFVSDGGCGETIDLVNQRGIADIVAVIGNDRTLGGMVHEIEENAASGAEADGADVGSALLELDVVWFTPRGDFYTIIGAGGATF